MKTMISLLLVVTFFSNSCKIRQPSVVKDGATSQYQGFPNYFEHVDQQTFNQALTSLARRLMLPVYGLNSDNVELEPFVVSINNNVKQNYGSEYEMMPSYGVTRTIIGYLYAQIHKQKLDNPEKPTSHVIREIVNSREPIPALQVRGIGSDLDFAIRRKDGKPVDDKILSGIKNDIVKMIVEPSLRAGATASKNTDKIFFVAPDVKDHITQVDRTKKQGGSEVDMIALSLDEGRVVEPDLGNHIIKDLLNGIYRYIDGESQNKDDRQKQTVRGLRALVELPWLSLDSKSERLLLFEMNQLNSELKADGQISIKSGEQLEKLTRNSWFSGANNRLWGGEPIAKAVGQFNQLYKEKKGEFGVPIFAPYRPTNQVPIKKDMPPELFTPVEEFIQTKTDSGKIYHGTSNAGLAIMREGLFLSGKDQGIYVYGPGVYTSALKGTARGYKDTDGWLFELTVSNDPKVKIFDFEKHKNEPWVEQKIHELGGRNNFFNSLREDYGVDIIVHNHILIQNASILVYPKSLKELYMAYIGTDVKDPLASLNKISYITNLRRYIIAAGEDLQNYHDPKELKKNIILNLNNQKYAPHQEIDLLIFSSRLGLDFESIQDSTLKYIIQNLSSSRYSLRQKNELLHMSYAGSNHGSLFFAALESGATPDSIAPYNGQTPMESAIEIGRLDVVLALLDKNADPNAEGRQSGRTRLHKAAEWGKLDIVKALLDNGGDPNLVRMFDIKNQEIVDELLRAKEKYKDIKTRASTNHAGNDCERFDELL